MDEIKTSTDMNVENNGAAAVEESAGAQATENRDAAPERKYTDEDVNRIISRKLAAERKRLQRVFNDEQQESELEQREKAVLKREMRADARDEMAARGLPDGFLDFLDYSDHDSMVGSIERLKDAFNGAVEQRVKELVRGTTPRANSAFAYGDTDAAIRAAFRA